MKNVAEEDRRSEAAPSDAFECLEQIVGISLYLAEMRVREHGRARRGRNRRRERRHGEILAAEFTTGTQVAQSGLRARFPRARRHMLPPRARGRDCRLSL